MLAIVMLLIRVLSPSQDQTKYLLPRNNKGKETSRQGERNILHDIYCTSARATPCETRTCGRNRALSPRVLQAWRKPRSIFTTSLLSAAGMKDFLPESQPAENDAVAQIMVFFSSNRHNFQWSRNSTTFFFAQYVQPQGKLLRSVE